MVEPISTAFAATTAGTVATPSVASASTMAPAATTAEKVGAIRQMAEEMIHSIPRALVCEGARTIVSESELVDEFAGPIYTGLTAVTSPTTLANKNMSLGAPAGEAAVTMPERSLSATSPMTKVGDTVVKAEQAVPNVSSEVAEKTADGVFSVEHSETRQLLDTCYKAPSIDEQVKAGQERIVVDRTLLDEKVCVESNGKKTAICLIEEKVIDRKYLDYGHLTDIMSEIRHGNIPTIRQIYLAIIDLADLATFRVFRPLLEKYKYESARVQVRQLSADLERKSLASKLPEMSSEQFAIDRNEEIRSWYKSDHVTERVGHIDTTVEHHIDLSVVNMRDVCSIEMSKEELKQLITKDKELGQLMGNDGSVVRIENSFSPEQIASINKSAIMWTQEKILTTTEEYTTDHKFNRYLTDLKGTLGEQVMTSDKNITSSGKKIFSEYLSEADNINLGNINTYEDALDKFASMEKTASLKTDSHVLDKYVEASAGTRFEDGWITYFPGGSIANLGVKADLGEKITMGDWFWAGVDVATFALAAVTSGAGKVAVGLAKTTGASGTRVAGSVALKTGAKATAKKTGKVVLSNVGKKARVKAGAKTAAKATTKTGFKANAKIRVKGFDYYSDKIGRCIKAEGRLKNVPATRNAANQKIAARLGKLGDEGGHLIPANYGGPDDLINHVPQARNVNRSTIKKIENELGKALKQGKTVDYTIMPHYPQNSLRPDKFTIRYKIDGVQKTRRILNG